MYGAVIRPRLLSWGATRDELQARQFRNLRYRVESAA